jgi:hypothetical protein
MRDLNCSTIQSRDAPDFKTVAPATGILLSGGDENWAAKDRGEGDDVLERCGKLLNHYPIRNLLSMLLREQDEGEVMRSSIDGKAGVVELHRHRQVPVSAPLRHHLVSAAERAGLDVEGANLGTGTGDADQANKDANGDEQAPSSCLEYSRTHQTSDLKEDRRAPAGIQR